MRSGIVGKELLPVELRKRFNNNRKPIDLELLVFRRMGIIKGPLFERDIFADKTDQDRKSTRLNSSH